MAWDREIALGLDVLLKDLVDMMCSQRHGVKCLEEVHSSLLEEGQVAQTSAAPAAKCCTWALLPVPSSPCFMSVNLHFSVMMRSLT